MKIFDLITEAPLNSPENKPKSTRTSDDWDELFGQSNFNTSTDFPTSPQPKAEHPRPEQRTMPPVSGDTTRARSANIRMDEPTSRMYNNIDHQAADTISNAQARANVDVGTPEPRLANPTPKIANPNPTSGNMPAVLGAAMAEAGEVTPEWHEVRNLPGYLSSGIRNIGRQVFSAFTTTPVERINVLAKIGAEGPNTLREMNAVASFVRDHGHRDSESEIEFHDKIVGYRADVQVYKAMGHTFMLVKDQAGNYIYSWPTADGDGLNAPTAPRLGGGQPRLR